MLDGEASMAFGIGSSPILKPADIPKRIPEIPSNATIPLCGLRNEGEPPVNKEIGDEVQRASLVTLKMLGVDLTKYQQNIGFTDIIDTTAVNEKGEVTFPRKPGADAQMLAIVVSSQPLYNEKGDEVPCYQTKDNMAYINLHMMDQYVTGTAPVKLKAGVATVEETIHYVQRAYWGRKVSEDNMDSVSNAALHVKDELEAEALPLKKIICDVLYPEADMQFVGL